MKDSIPVSQTLELACKESGWCGLSCQRAGSGYQFWMIWYRAESVMSRSLLLFDGLFSFLIILLNKEFLIQP